MGATSKLKGRRLIKMRAVFTIATIVSLALFARVSADTCASSCFSENCDFYVKNWGISCDTAESEYGCSCAGCACEDTEEAWMKSERTYGRRTGTGTGTGSTATTVAPTSSPTAEGAVRIRMTVSLAITSAQFTDTVQDAFKESVAMSLSNSDITADHVIILSFSRRSTLNIQFEVVTPYTTTGSNVNSLASTLTSQMTSSSSTGFTSRFNTAAAAAVSGWTNVAAPTITSDATVTTLAPTAAPVSTVINSAPASAGLSLVSMAAVALAVKQLL